MESNWVNPDVHVQLSWEMDSNWVKPDVHVQLSWEMDSNWVNSDVHVQLSWEMESYWVNPDGHAQAIPSSAFDYLAAKGVRCVLVFAEVCSAPFRAEQACQPAWKGGAACRPSSCSAEAAPSEETLHPTACTNLQQGDTLGSIFGHQPPQKCQEPCHSSLPSFTR